MTEPTLALAEPTLALAKPTLSVKNLTVRYSGARGAVDAVKGVTFDIAQGEVFGLVGESGSGKSSVCQALMRLLPVSAKVTADNLHFGGHDILGLKEKEMNKVRGREMAMIPQQPMTSLSPVTPIGTQLRWYFGDRLDDPDLQKKLIRIGLQAVLDRRDDLPSRFSGGQLQRLLIAIATLSNQPTLLLADEPTTTLDVTVQAQVLGLLLEAKQRLNLSILYISHDLAVIAQVCDRVGVMYGGRLVEVATVDELFHNPRHPYTKALLGAMPSEWTRGEMNNGTIPGSASGANRLEGCPFAPRCTSATEECHHVMPDAEVTSSSQVSCHHVGSKE